MVYPVITNADVTAGAPLSQSLMTALRDLVPSMAAGEDGAPRISLAALPSPVAGTSVKLSRDAEEINTGLTSNTSLTFRSFQAGTVRLTLEQQRDPTNSGTATATVTKNGTTIQTWDTTSASYVSRSLDITVALGDNIAVTHVGSSTDSYLRNVRLQTDGESLWPFQTNATEIFA